MFPETQPPSRTHLLMRPYVDRCSKGLVSFLWLFTLSFVFIMMVVGVAIAACIVSVYNLGPGEGNRLYEAMMPYGMALTFIMIMLHLAILKPAMEIKEGAYLVRGGCIPFDKWKEADPPEV